MRAFNAETGRGFLLPNDEHGGSNKIRVPDARNASVVWTLRLPARPELIRDQANAAFRGR